jgi:hypothetical protein
MMAVHSIKVDYKAYYCERMIDCCFSQEISKDYHENLKLSLTENGISLYILHFFLGFEAIHEQDVLVV